MNNPNEEREKKRQPVSLWWTFIPMFLGFAGGLIAWRLTKKKHNEMAMVLLIFGIVFTVIIIPFYLWLLSIYF